MWMNLTETTTRTLDPASVEGKFWAELARAESERQLAEIKRNRECPMAWFIDQLGDA